MAWNLHCQYPSSLIVVCADDDWKTRNNPGVTKARQAAFAGGGAVAIPSLPKAGRGPKDTDFNDMARVSGAESVKDLLRLVVKSGLARMRKARRRQGAARKEAAV